MITDEGLLHITNYQAHPTNPEFQVFRFKTAWEAETFAGMLKEHSIYFEQDENREDDEPYLFAIKRRDLKRVMRFNYLTSAKHRKPFIRIPFFKWLLIGVTVAVIVMAIVGSFVRPL